MLKRFYSKRSGFTLVEIIVAFAVFALMAAMIGQVLQLSIAMRRSNSAYASALANQEQYLTVADKNKTDFTEDGKFSLQFTDPGLTSDIANIDFTYTMMSADEETAGRNTGEGINYFVSGIEYVLNDGDSSTPDFGGSNFNTGSQAARQDTRITGTANLGYVQISKVIKDTHTYDDPSDPLYLPPGHTRYLFETRASTKPYDTEKYSSTFKTEDGSYAQYKMYFYMGSPGNTDPSIGIDAAATSATETTDADGKTYTKNIYKTAKIVNMGYINAVPTEDLVLTKSNTSASPSSVNVYTVQATNDFTIRVGTPFVQGYTYDKQPDLANGKGFMFEAGYASRFYVDFYDPEGILEITPKSFGFIDTLGNDNGAQIYSGEPGVFYLAAPVWADEYESDGTPTYTVPKEGEHHVNIYGAYINKRNYK